jgi:Uma2 family endonuclease
MATNTMVTIDEYLRSSYEGTDREYVDGEVVERSMSTYDHGEMQVHWGVIVHGLKIEYGLPFRVVSEVRHLLSPERVRIPDVAIFVGPRTESRVPTSPPLVAIEILSPDDRMTELLEKLREYELFGVAHMWLIDPEKRSLYNYERGTLQEVREFVLPEYSIVISHDTVFTI